MKILFCNKYNFRFSGTEAYLFDLMRMLRDAGHTTALFSMADPRGEPSDFDRFLAPAVDFKRPHGRLEGLHLAAHAIYSRGSRAKLAQLLEEFRPDVAHVRNIYHHLSPSILWELKKQHVPVVYHLNDFKLLCPNYNFVSRGAVCERCRGGQFWKLVHSGCYEGGRAAGAVLAAEAYIHRWLRTYERCVDCFLVPSKFVGEKLIEYGWPESRIEVLPHFQTSPDTPPAGPASDAAVLYFGRLSAEKGLTDLLAAMQQLPKIHLVIAGDGPRRKDLERLCAEARLAVRFAGHVDGSNLEQLISQSAFTVFPSRAYETLGKSILESYAQGRAVVASDLGSRRQFVRPGITGLLFPPGDVAALAESIEWLYAHPKIAHEMGEAGRDLLSRYHSPQQHCTEIMALYEKAIRWHRESDNQAPESEKKARALHVAFIGGRGVVSQYSGIEAYYEEVGRRLADRGHDVTVYCRNYFTPAIPTHNGMRLVRLPTLRSKYLETLIHTAFSTAHAMCKRYDIVHYHALGPALFSFFPRLLGVSTAVTVQGLDWQRKKWTAFAAYVLRLGELASALLPNSTMVVSQTLREYYRRRFSNEPTYIPNGALLREPSEPHLLKQWGVDAGKYVLFLGRFSPEKNCLLLVEAFEQVETDAKLILAGGFGYDDAYGRELKLHANDRIRFFDYVSGDALDELLTNAALFVLPSDLEGLSLALLEAMGAGRCVLTSDIPENCELVDGIGFTFRRGDALDLARMLRLLLADPEMRERSGQSARRRIAEQYNWDVITRQIEAEYFRILGRWPLGPRLAVTVNHEARVAGRHDMG